MEVKLVLFSLLLHIGGLIPCGGSKNTGGEVVLDLLKVDASSFDTFATRPYQTHVKTFVPKDGCTIKEVKEGKNSLLKANGHHCDNVVVLFDKNDALSHVLVHLKDCKTPVYHEKVNGKWHTTTEEDFYDAFHQRVLNENVFETVDIDTSKKETCDKYFVTNSPNFPFLVYAPNVGYHIKKVSSGQVVWEAKDEDERCIYVSLYPRDEPKLVNVVVKNSFSVYQFFFKHEGSRSKWTSIEKATYARELEASGFKVSEFNDHVKLDIGNVDKDLVYTHSYTNNLTVDVHYPLPGLVVNEVVDGHTEVWKSKSQEEYCTYVNVAVHDKSTLAMYIFVDSGDDRKVLYFQKKGHAWKSVDKKKYFALFSTVDGVELVHNDKEDHKILVGSFKNHQGLRVVTYASEVENSKGNFVLVPDIRSHFRSDLCTCSLEWNRKHFGFPLFPRVDPLGEYKVLAEPKNVDRYKDVFKYKHLDGANALELSPRYEYEGTLTKFLNDLGYSVYSLDLQSQGLSDSVKDIRCYTRVFKDYVYDVMQFVNIVKRGKFGDPNEKWDEKMVYENTPTDKKIFLLGNSMGGNIVFQAVQEFHRVKKGGKFVDGLVGLSAVLNIDCNLDTPAKRASKKALKVAAWSTPEKMNPYEDLFNYGESFECFMRFRDPLHYPNRTTFGTLQSIFDACSDVTDNMRYYPKDLATLFIHASKDALSGVEGPKEVIKHLNHATLVELGGSCHYLAAPQLILNIVKPLNEWLNKHK
ncbi:conserved hypothetical protein [Theileria equi strain WA]|uniref:Serine aminopeptidase S33 domain-containing protein n=1 Tax=Theileria equi strain WA TaxID=1537102 RepID=L1LFK4_THEEQ|nr:conserved hypothetical protein [Theileria equi strain WA]EKX74136.1 conserved hypothetical protein [Theileria equi strain WA]|eukprot:XP_004833588.1 conserved hypothetical protein [Theileria equi strain WA]